jgi:2-polyprenyl-6-hydroxyphenyl methylase/3-demethylubiquinone-9 3-methyltransferase
MWPLHKLNELRAPYVREQICTHLTVRTAQTAPLTGVRVLDIGCGAGLLSESLAAYGASVVGVDPAERNISIAKAHAEQSGLPIDYRVGSVEALAPDEQFDVLLNMEVVEHVAELPSFIARCCTHVRPGGLHFIATINRNLISWLVAIVGAEYVLRWLPRGTHQWRKFVRPDEVDAMLAPHDHEVLVRRGVSINPITRHYRLSDYLGVNYMITARRLSGGQTN